MKAKKINLDDWYTAEQARARLSTNSGRKIDISYPRTLAKYGKVRTVEVSARGKLYWKADIDGYVVSGQRGRKAKQES